MAACVLAALLYFRDTNWLSENVFAAWQHGARAKHFFEVVSGTAMWRDQLTQLALGAAGIVAIVLLMRTGRWIAGVPIVVIGILLGNHSFFRAWALLHNDRRASRQPRYVVAQREHCGPCRDRCECAIR